MSTLMMLVITLSIIMGIQSICIFLFDRKMNKINGMLKDLQIDVKAYELLKAQTLRDKNVNSKNKVGSWLK